MEYQKNCKNLHRKYVWMILEKFEEEMRKLKSLVHIPIENEKEITVCGDTHG